MFIPAGAIFSAQPDAFEPIRLKIRWFTKVEGAINYVTKVKNYEGFKFVRMSLLSLPEDIRASAGGDTYIHQQDKTKGYINYDWLTPEIIADYASQRLRNAGILFSPYSTRNKQGFVAVLGPARMRYSNIVPAVRYTKRLIEELGESW